MRSPFTHRATVVRALLTLAICSGAPSASRSRARAKEIECPETGTPVQRARALWQASRTHILEDARRR
jgi:hypothetical protein